MSELPNDLAQRCSEYLQAGPPPHMTGYVPGSLTEIVIEHGARSRALDPELEELAQLIVDDSEDYSRTGDEAVVAYLRQGRALVAEILAAQNEAV